MKRRTDANEIVIQIIKAIVIAIIGYIVIKGILQLAASY